MIGKVKIFKCGEDPATQKPQMTIKTKVGGNLSPVLGVLAKRYSPVRSKWLQPFGLKCFDYNFLEYNKRVFVYEEGDWSVKGRFKAALEDNDPIFWEQVNGEYSLFVALVSACYAYVAMLLKSFRRMRLNPGLLI